MTRAHRYEVLALVLAVLTAAVGCLPSQSSGSTDPNDQGPVTTPTRVAPAGNGVAMLDQLGKWFFILRTPDGNAVFTQRGDFTLNPDGKIIYANGWYVQGFKADAQGQIRPKLLDLKIVIGQASPVYATTVAVLTGNINPEDAAVGYKISTSFTVYDGNGDPATLFVEATVLAKDATTTQLQFDAYQGTSAGQLLARAAFSFNEQGNIVGTSVLPVGISGGSPLTFNLDLSNVKTSTRKDPSLKLLSQDGRAKGSLQSYSIGNDGKITGQFSNGLSLAIGQFVIASFDNVDGLTAVAGRSDLFVQTDASGPPRPAISIAQ